MIKRLISIKWLLFLLFFTFSSSQGQDITSSPYSRYGIGDIKFQGLAHQSALGGSGIAADSGFHINPLNPAAHSSVQLTTFEAGVFGNTTRTSSSKASQTVSNSSLNYLVFGFPLTKWWGASAGLMPYSGVGYNIADTVQLPDIGQVNYSYQGSGGINKVFVGNGFKYKNISAGFNFEYYFGHLQQTRKTYLVNLTNGYNVSDNNQVSVKDFNFSYGVQYKFKIDSAMKKNPVCADTSVNLIRKNKSQCIVRCGTDSCSQPLRIMKDIPDWKFGFGLTFNLGKSLNARHTLLTETFVVRNGAEQVKDLVRLVNNEKGSISLPASYGFGISIERAEKLRILADYTLQDWTSFTSFGKSDSLSNSWRASLGIQYIPDNTVNNFFKQTQYRAGFYYSQSYLKIRESHLTEIGITAGLGIPLKKTRSTINVSVIAGKRGTLENNLLEEKFVQAVIGFTLNDKWFNRRKID